MILGAGCRPPDPATFEMAVRMGQIWPETLPLTLSDLSLEVAAVRLRSCPDTPNERNFIRGFSSSERPRVLLPSAGPINVPIGGRLLATRDLGFDVLVGPWCSLDVVFDGPLCLVGVSPDTGAALRLALQLPDLTFPAVERLGRVEEVEDPGTRKAKKVIRPSIVELAAGPWLEEVLPDLEAGADVTVRPPDPAAPAEGDARHDALVARLLAGQGPAIYHTADADTALTDAERAAAPLGLGAPAGTIAPLQEDPCGFDAAGL